MSELPTPNTIRRDLSSRTKKSDLFLLEAWDKSGLSSQEDIGLFAVGGYGRKQLHPFSDIDLLLLSDKKINPNLVPKVESFIQKIWDLDYQVGHSIRTFKEEEKQIKNDIQAMTNILESRKIIGSNKLESKLYSLLNSKNIWPKDSFLLEKIEEQKDRHSRFDNTEYNLEPNLKSSPGGLRDIHTIDWIILNYLREGFDPNISKNSLSYNELKELDKARKWIWLLRYLLHIEAGKEEDRLLFNFQLPIGEALFPKLTRENASIEKLMHRYFRSAQNISEINQSFLENISSKLKKRKVKNIKPICKNFELENNKIKLKVGKSFKSDPGLMIEIFITSSLHKKTDGIELSTLRKIRENKNLIDSKFRKINKNDAQFLNLLKLNTPKTITELEKMHSLGVLSRLMPEFGRVTAQMQYDLFHIYTVDIHTLKLLKKMNKLIHEKGEGMFELASKLSKELPSTLNLYLSGFFHDIGKGRGGNHSSLGKRIVRRFCKRNNFSQEDTDLIEWLVGNHLLMSKTSQKKDLSDSRVIDRFAKEVGSIDRLNYLYCLTVSDISATNPNLWNSWNSSLLRELWIKTRNKLINESQEEDKKKLIKENLSGFNKKVLNSLWKNFYDNYFKSLKINLIEKQTQLLLNSERNSTVVKFIEDDSDEILNLFIYTTDRPNVFSSVVSVLDSENINIFDARLFGTKNGYCIESIAITDDSKDILISDKEKIKEIEDKVYRALNKKELKPKFVSKRMPVRLKSFSKKTEVNINQDLDNLWTELEISTLDRPGLLASICKILTNESLSIKKASISTYGEIAEDRFYIVSESGGLLEDQNKISKLNNLLSSTLSGDEIE
ncbi:MAG: [protein-PII] uridylyltransferase [Gammaproteobacteria bacterium]